MPDVSVLEVQLFGETVGTLTNIGGDRTIFAFTQSYVEDSSRRILSLSFKDEFGELITDLPAKQRRVAPFFANLLPEGPLRRYLAEQAGVNPEREFFLLWALGQDLPGALTIKPSDGETWPPNLKDNPQPYDPGHNDTLRFSLAGVQLKFSAVQNAGKHGGLTVPAHGVGGDWIVKLPSAHFEGVPENEFSMLSLARRIGINVPEIQLVDIERLTGLPNDVSSLKGQAFVIRRFDRTSGGPIHMEDFAQVFSVYPENKYKNASYRNIAYVLGIEASEDDIAEFIRRLVFNTLIGNGDMHLKNWSLIYPDGRSPALAPAYDFLSTLPYTGDVTAALKFSRTRRFDEFDYDELAHLAGKAGLPEHPVLETAKETVENFLTAWKSEKANLPLSSTVAAAVDEHLKRLPILR